MLALAWTALNVLLFVLVVYAWVRVFKLLRREIGVGLALLFLLSLSAFRSGRDEASGKAQNLATPDPTRKGLGNWSTHAVIPMNVNNKLNLIIEGKWTDSTFQAYGLYATVSGLLAGHEWKPIAGAVNADEKQLHYQIVVLHNWKLFGNTIYTNSDEYTGIIASSHD
ncbi:hypothetical protein [Hymenobacter sp. DG01]|uniref:hypothetical protein n=1 Tax=Hymenobacter sp. DG01 TaxID=2584940 RepID=UPI001C5FC120|nr:hypothetical protein [Hymenobacter sp. DG01]